jgi:dihydrodipicolinate synthase/N-acetylneuraminate lyase
VPGLKGLVPNGHTGEIKALSPEERVRVTGILAEEVRKVSGVGCQPSLRASCRTP